jgi:predicted ATPase/class 3 adenylate cyclase
MGHPTVEVALLFTDIEGSTALAQQLGDGYIDVLAEHNRIMREALAQFHGAEARNEGDSFFATFERPVDAVNAALTAQRALAGHSWSHGRVLRVRMGLHHGHIIRLERDFAGLSAHLAARVMSAGHGGQVLASQQLLDALPSGADFAWDDLGSHILKDFAEPVRLFQLSASGLGESFPPLVTIDARDHNLPATVTSFVGRADELALLRSRLSGDARLVTLTGPGGAGKTRIAIEVAWSVLSRFRAGAWFVDFSAVTDANSIVDVIADTLGVVDRTGATRRNLLVETLAKGPTLLVLDNLEHLLSGVVAISSLLAACPTLVVIATSRERLRLQGENEVMLEGLLKPDAVDLFAARAALAGRDFVVDDRVEEMCLRTDGLPLAIELAAARLRTHTVDELLAAMDHMLDTLAEGERDRPERHRGLRAMIRVSVNALTGAERSVFRSFAVFGGGATADAVTSVCGPEPGALQSLVDKSLIRSSGESGRERFTMLEPIRQFAEELLLNDAPGVYDGAVRAHAQFFLGLAEHLEPDLVTARQRNALDELTADHANLRLAWERAAGDVPLRIASCLTRFWVYRAHPHEGRAVLARLLNEAADPDVRARAQLGAGNLAVLQHDLDAAVPLLRAAADGGNLQTKAAAHNLLGEVARLSGELDVAAAQYDEAVAIADAAGDERIVGLVRNNEAVVAIGSGEYDQAVRLSRAALAIAERVGDEQAATRAIGNLGLALRLAGDAATAVGVFRRSLESARAAHDRAAEAYALHNIAETMSQLDGFDEATASSYLYEAISIFDELGYRRELANSLLCVPAVVDEVDDALRAIARARAIFVELRDEVGISRADDFRDAVTRLVG